VNSHEITLAVIALSLAILGLITGLTTRDILRNRRAKRSSERLNRKEL
jgi:hypothetical protein